MASAPQTRNGLYGFEFREPDLRRQVKERRVYNIKQLWQRSHEIINLAANGFKNVEIAEILNLDPQTVSNTLNSDLGQHKLSELRLGKDEQAKIRYEKIRVLVDKAINTYHEIFDDESGECSLRDKKAVADTVLLELSGLRAPTKIQSQHVSTSLTMEELEEFKRRGIQAAKESGLVIDVPAKQVEERKQDVCDPSDSSERQQNVVEDRLNGEGDDSGEREETVQNLDER
jgi:DNA-binding CsgD family transcriptional regulator